MSPDHPSTEPLLSAAPITVALRLSVVSGPDFGKSLLLERGSYLVGKSSDADLPLTDPAVSRSHLTVQVLSGKARFVDNGSRNGSFFNDNKFGTVEAGPGAQIRVGKTVLRLELAAAPKAALRPAEAQRFGALVGKSVAMREVFAVLDRCAKSEVDLLLVGETGTGKEAAARAVHEGSARKKGPFVVIDLGALPPELAEAELFGHVRGAFTGANSDRPGPFERARGGTVLLDGISHLPVELQPRLLRVLEGRSVRRVGGDGYQAIDVRVISVSQEPLQPLVEKKRFRGDLFHRISPVTVTIPPLRERLEDLPLLVDALCEAKGFAKDKIGPEARALLPAYTWPGNVRELENLLARVSELGLEAFPAAAASTSTSHGGELPFKDAKERLVDAFEKDYLVRLMDRCEGNLSRAAREASVERLHLRKLLKKHGLHGG